MMDGKFLLNHDDAEKFLNDNSEQIFGEKTSVKLKQVKRSKTYNPEVYNLLYDLKVGSYDRFVRVSASKFFSKKHDFGAMSYLYNNGFAEIPFFVPKPIAYMEKENILIYEDFDGDILTNSLKLPIDKLSGIIKSCALLSRKVHSLKPPTIELFDPQTLFIYFEYELVMNKFPKAKNLENIVNKIKDSLPVTGNLALCHGDFNPNNILIKDDILCLIDFGITSIFHKEIDFASFLAHMRQMIGINQKPFEELKKAFLSSCDNFDERTLYLLMSLIDCRLLEISVKFNQAEYDSEFVWECLRDDLKRANLEVENES